MTSSCLMWLCPQVQLLIKRSQGNAAANRTNRERVGQSAALDCLLVLFEVRHPTDWSAPWTIGDTHIYMVALTLITSVPLPTRAILSSVLHRTDCHLWDSLFLVHRRESA